MAEQKFKRRQKFIDKRFQSKVIGVGVALILLVGAIGIFGLSMATPGKTSGQALDAGDVMSDFSTMLLALLLVISVVVFITIYYGLQFSHRIVGPIFAFNRHLNWQREGIYVRDLRLRKKDEFKNLARVFNKTQDVLRQRVKTVVDACEKAEGTLNEIKTGVGTSDMPVDKTREMLELVLKELDALKAENEKYITKPS